VLQDREGRFVYLLGKNNTVSQRRIGTGASVGSGWAVTSGLDGGEQVVVQGIQRLAEGMTVQPSEGQPVGGGS
jgi:membrane fusion protein (multidrug efflux system)